MIRLQEVIVVEGRYDRNALNQVVDALTQCNGFSWDTHRYCHPKRKPFQDRGKESQKHKSSLGGNKAFPEEQCHDRTNI